MNGYRTRPTARAHSRAMPRPAASRGWQVMLAMTATLTLAIILTATQAARAATWTLDDGASFFSFGSIKARDIGEVHSFSTLSGTVAEDGSAEVSIDLTSVNTGIDIRNERMRDVLFHAAQFPVATLTASVPLNALEELPVGKHVVRDVTADLTIVGETNALSTPLMITRLGEDRVMAQPLRLLMIQADDYALGEGIRKLREIAGLEHISHAVPATFTLFFSRDE